MKYFIGFVVTIFLIIFLVILLVSGGGGKDSAKVPATSKALVSYATTDATVRMTIDGPVTADQTHQEVRVTVGKDSAVYEQINGYDGTVASMQSYHNNANAYGTFLQSLSRAGYTKGDTAEALKDERGYCAQGNRYIFEVMQNGKTLQRFWTTSCNKTKTYLGVRGLTVDLFQAQIPDYNKLTNHVKLSSGSFL